jgi:hypothetical protein
LRNANWLATVQAIIDRAQIIAPPEPEVLA